MPLTLPALDDRKYQDLLDAALARIPVHTPEWTNFNRSDPGVTLIEVFAFLTETLLYRANQIPERNRRKFLTLLGVALRPATSARGIVAFTNVTKGATLRTITLAGGSEVSAPGVPFRTEVGLDVLPIDAPVMYKRELTAQNDPQIEQKRAYYQALYASYLIPPADGSTLRLYETVPLEPRPGEPAGLDIGATVDQSAWVALLARAGDDPELARAQIAGKTVSLGIVPLLVDGAGDARRALTPGQRPPAEALALLEFYLPDVPPSGRLPADGRPTYKKLPANTVSDVLAEPGVVQITLPGANALRLWNNLDPLEAGVRDLPPSLEDNEAQTRIITWLRVRLAKGARANVLWMGINAAMVAQRAHVAAELVGEGNGEPDQVVRLARTPVLPGSVRISVTEPGASAPATWHEIDDLLSAGPEVPAPDALLPPGRPAAIVPRAEVFALDAEAGVVRFGDGTRGRRPALGSTIRADYDYSVGRAGNVGPRSISRGVLPEGLKVLNPVRTWGGADAETVSEGEKQIARFLQHRDRLVTAEDFRTIVRRTPGVDIGRVEVLPAYHAEKSQSPGDDAGAGVVTLMLIPRHDPTQPDAPKPDPAFLDAVCAYLDPRRIVTTEVLLRGPAYVPIWISVAIGVTPGASVAVTQQAVRQALTTFLSPFDWPLHKPVIDRELIAVISRAPNVQLVNGLQIALNTGPALPSIPMQRLQLPRVLGISVVTGDAPLDIAQIRTLSASTDDGSAATKDFVSVPVIPEACG